MLSRLLLRLADSLIPRPPDRGTPGGVLLIATGGLTLLSWIVGYMMMGGF